MWKEVGTSESLGSKLGVVYASQEGKGSRDRNCDYSNRQDQRLPRTF
jgi:hypothetical protein